ncbi:MAG: methionyl-tRNA formyltransferase [Bacteroidota bacterium]
MRSLRIIFMGTPEFAVASLAALVNSRHQVIGVVTAPDKPQGRGLKPIGSAVKEFAVAANLPVLQPEKLKSEDFLQALKELDADLFMVVAFRMLPEVVWSMPPMGTYNLHASLLPAYRGAAPINWAIINGETETGITTFRIRQEIDTGDILFREHEPIHPQDDAGSLYDRLMNRGAALVVKTADAIADGTAVGTPQPQQTGDLPLAPKIFRETCSIDWNNPSKKVIDLIRGLSPYPAAWTTINGKSCKIFRASLVQRNEDAAPGTMRSDNRQLIEVRTADGWISIDELQPEGKKRMTSAAFLAGNRI